MKIWTRTSKIEICCSWRSNSGTALVDFESHIYQLQATHQFDLHGKESLFVHSSSYFRNRVSFVHDYIHHLFIFCSWLHHSFMTTYKCLGPKALCRHFKCCSTNKKHNITEPILLLARCTHQMMPTALATKCTSTHFYRDIQCQHKYRTNNIQLSYKHQQHICSWHTYRI